MRKGTWLILLIMVVIPLVVFAATFTLDTSGNWNDTASWNPTALPGATDDVDINNGITTTIINGDNFEVASIATSNNIVININEGGSLTITNPGNDAFTAQNNETINVDGDLIIDGNLVINNNLVFNVGPTGTVTITGDVTINNGASLDISGSVTVDGDFTGGNNTNVNVDGDLDVGGTIDTGNGSDLTGSGTVSAGGGCTGDPDFCAGSPLPIDLIYFTGQSIKNQIKLEWESSNEENFDYYTIEKSFDTENFETLGIIEGQGGFNKTHSYNYIDEVPFSGLNYYRLKATDLDGSFKYHKIIGVLFDGNLKDNFIVYPNPNKDGLITIRPPERINDGLIKIYDSFGLLIYQCELNSISKSIELPSDIKSGTYFIKMIGEGKAYTQRLILTK